MLVSISTMPAEKCLLEYIKQIEDVADFIHCDVCDGKYNSAKCFSTKLCKLINNNSLVPIDVHLMTNHALSYAKKYAKCGANIITAHYESFKNKRTIAKFINYLKNNNDLCGLSIEPETKIDVLKPYLRFLDIILVMSVKTGESGQKFDEIAVEKVNKLQELKQQNKYAYKIEVDGGINDQTAKKVKNADIVVSGSYVFSSKDRKKAIRDLQNI